MRITQVMLTKGFGGAERSFVDTVLALAERGHQVQAICQPNFVKRNLLEGNENITLSCVKQSGWWDELAASRIRRAILEYKPSVVHAHLARGSWLAGRALQGVDLPLVCKLHNYANLAYYKYVDHFIGTTVDQRRYLKENNYPDHRISVIPNFSRLQPISAAPEALECNSSSPCTFITCGRLNPVKGFDILLRAFRLAFNKNHNLRLIIGGEGEEKPILQKIISELDLQEHVELAGWIDDVPTFLDRGNVYVVSSRSESFGIALLEAMSRGLPVITTRTKGPSQILSEANAWFAETEDEFSLKESIIRAAEDYKLRQQRGEEMVRIYQEKYFKDSVLGRIEELYESLAKSPASVSAFQVDDQQQITTRSDARGLLKQVGIATSVEALTIPLSQTLRDVDGRQTGIVNGVETSTKLFLKRHLQHENTSKDFIQDGEKEFEAVQLCERAGVPTLKVLACGKNDNPDAGPIGSFLITSEAGGGISANQLSHSWRSDPGNRSKTSSIRHDLIVSIAETTHKLHAAKLYHQDLYWTHFFPSRSEDGKVTAHLIDVQRLTHSTNVVSRFLFQLKDLAQLRFSMEWVGLNKEEINFFYSKYFSHQESSISKTISTTLVPTMAWMRSLGRLTKLIARRKSRTQAETVAIELGSAPYVSEIPIEASGVDHNQKRAA